MNFTFNLNKKEFSMRKIVSKFTLAASLVLAITFTLSCSSDDKDEGGGSCSADFGEVTIGSQIWAKKNLNCNIQGSLCYDNDPANCAIYGRLYDWTTALTACPSGWHLPSKAEWDVLTAHVGGENSAGKKLKAASGGGTDDYDFSALLGGRRTAKDRMFTSLGTEGYWWSATERSAGDAYCLRMTDSQSYARLSDEGDKVRQFSVRCIKD
jgi:uncharacterized protein (TIGR02145 family)